MNTLKFPMTRRQKELNNLSHRLNRSGVAEKLKMLPILRLDSGKIYNILELAYISEVSGSFFSICEMVNSDPEHFHEYLLSVLFVMDLSEESGQILLDYRWERKTVKCTDWDEENFPALLRLITDSLFNVDYVSVGGLSTVLKHESPPFSIWWRRKFVLFARYLFDKAENLGWVNAEK